MNAINFIIRFGQVNHDLMGISSKSLNSKDRHLYRGYNIALKDAWGFSLLASITDSHVFSVV